MTSAGASPWTRARGRWQALADGDPLDDGSGAVGPRRWPWALLAAGLGAVGGAAVALLVRRQVQADAPGAQQPHELRAVVDRPTPEATQEQPR